MININKLSSVDIYRLNVSKEERERINYELFDGVYGENRIYDPTDCGHIFVSENIILFELNDDWYILICPDEDIECEFYLRDAYETLGLKFQNNATSIFWNEF